MAFTGNKNGTGRPPGALERMWNRDRASTSSALARVLLLATVAERWLSMSARQLLRCRRSMQSSCFWPRSCIFEPIKNKMNESMFLHADERIRIVDRYIITVKLQIRALNANIWRARGRIRTPILGRFGACFQCSGLEERRKCVAMRHGSRRVDVGVRAVVRLFRW